jgi:V8-like Glu-specific endopeptidase
MRRQLWSACQVIFFSLFALKAHAVRPTVIYGNDNREDYYQADSAWQHNADSTVALIRDSNLEQQGLSTAIKTIPYGAGMGLCKSEPFYEQETAAFCSGFLVAPDLVATAGHCVRNQANCDSTKIVFGFRLDSAGSMPREVSSDHVFSCSSIVHTVFELKGEDFSIVKLDRPVTFVAPVSFRKQGMPVVGDSLKVIGHPAGLPLKLAGGAAVRALDEKFFVANLDTYGGNSGSAVFNSVTGEVEGVLVRGEADYIYKDGCRISNRCDDNGCRGESVTLFSRLLPYIPY